MFERFTDRARRVITSAQGESMRLQHDYIGTEHILLGLLADAESVAANTLVARGLPLDAVRRDVEEMIGRGSRSPQGDIPFSTRAKKVLQLSMRESLGLEHDYIGTEHILLGLLREGEGVAAQVLIKFGADLTSVREQVVELLGGNRPHPTGSPDLLPGDLDRAAADLTRRLAEARSLARELWAELPGRTKHRLSAARSEPLPPWLSDPQAG